MLTILLTDTELELIPKDMQDDYSIRIHAKKRKKAPHRIILDSNFMHTAIDRFYPGESTRRGRPDIVYLFLSVVMESILNKKGELKVWIHTRNNRIIEVAPDVRLPKSYNRFIGLIEDLYEKGEIRSNEKLLLKVHNGDVRKLLELSGSRNLKIFSPKGEKTSLNSFFDPTDRDQSVMVGGFSEGDFRSDVYSLGDSCSIFGDELTIWSVAMEAIAQYERDFDIV